MCMKIPMQKQHEDIQSICSQAACAHPSALRLKQGFLLLAPMKRHGAKVKEDFSKLCWEVVVFQ